MYVACHHLICFVWRIAVGLGAGLPGAGDDLMPFRDLLYSCCAIFVIAY